MDDQEQAFCTGTLSPPLVQVHLDVAWSGQRAWSRAQLREEDGDGQQQVTVLCGRRRLVFFPGGCQRDVLANLECICQCCVGFV
jgi:hypothetical protein